MSRYPGFSEGGLHRAAWAIFNDCYLVYYNVNIWRQQLSPKDKCSFPFITFTDEAKTFI